MTHDHGIVLGRPVQGPCMRRHSLPGAITFLSCPLSPAQATLRQVTPSDQSRIPSSTILHLYRLSSGARQVALHWLRLPLPRKHPRSCSPQGGPRGWRQVAFQGALNHSLTERDLPSPLSVRLREDNEIQVPIQINGKVKATVSVVLDSDEAIVKELVHANESIQKQLEGKTIRKEIYVKNKIYNIVVG